VKTSTVAEVAEYFRTTKPTVLRWVREGKIPAAVATGKIYRFDLEAVRAALAAPIKSKP
jgi:excisionase family DNA binding protein